jgi:hypothetical protein
MKNIEISFEFRGRPYDAVIRVRERIGIREFNIIILDRDLERLLYGNQVIRQIDGNLQADILADRKEQTELKLIIASRLSDFLKIPCFIGDSCLAGGAREEGWEDLHPIPRHEHSRPFI